MATESAPAARPRRMYWQLPVFAVGLTAAVLAWRYFPPPAVAGQQQIDRDRYTLRQAVARRPVNVGEVQALLTSLGDAGTRAGGDADVAFVQGSAYLVLAEQGPAEQAADNWKRAHALFAECDPAKLTDKQDRTRCGFRAAKAAAGAGEGDPTAIIQQLEVVPNGEEPGERSRLLAEAYLRPPKPDVKKAKEALASYLSGPPHGTPEQAAGLKLKLADLCVATGEGAKARDWLKDFGDPVPASLQADAKLRLARLALAENDVNEAVKLFQAAEALPNLAPAQQAVVRYETGRGLIQLGNPTAGREYLQKAADTNTPAGAAAAVLLAELSTRDPDPTVAVTYLEMALKGVKTPAEWTNTNPHLPLADVRTACEAVIAACKTAGKFAPAARASEVYAVVAEGGKDRELWADVMTAWAAAPGTADAADKYKKAADEFAKLAESRQDAAKAPFLLKAAAAYTSAGDTTNAIAVLKKLSELPGLSGDVLAAVQLLRADALLTDGKLEEGVKLLSEAAATAGPAGTKAAVRLALVYAAEGKKLVAVKATEADGRKQVEYAVDLLTELANRTYTSAEERLCHQQALYELGKLELSGAVPSVRNVSDAETRFRRLTVEYKAGPHTESGTLYLGIALSQLAQGAASGGVPPADAGKKFAEAKKLFESLGKANDAFIRAQADIRLAHTLLFMKEFEAATDTGTALADKYRGKVEELILLSIVYSAHSQSKRPDRAKGTLERIQKAFAALPDSAYSDNMDEYTRAYWVKYLDRLGEK